MGDLSAMEGPEQIRHRPPTPLDQPRELILACPPFRSSVNLSRIVRAAGVSGIQRIITAGPARIDKTIARDGAETVTIDSHRSLLPVLKKLRGEGFVLTGLEQTNRSKTLYDYEFARKTVLILGSEREGIESETLAILDDAVEIPVYGLPYAHNVATAAAIALYEYCRQFPRG